MHCQAWCRITWLAIVSWLHFPDGDPCGLRSDASAMYHVRTAPLVTVHSLPPARAYGTSSRSAYVTLGYCWLFSTNIWKHTYSPSRFETTAHLWHLWFICTVYKFTYLLTYLLRWKWSCTALTQPLPKNWTETEHSLYKLLTYCLDLVNKHCVYHEQHCWCSLNICCLPRQTCTASQHELS